MLSFFGFSKHDSKQYSINDLRNEYKRGQIHEQQEQCAKEQEEDRQEYIDYRINCLRNLIIVKCGNKIIIDNYTGKALLKAQSEEWAYIKTYKYSNADLDINSIEESEIYDHNAACKYWDKYIPHLEVELEYPYSYLIDKNRYEVLNFINSLELSINEVIQILSDLSRYNITRYSKYMKDMLIGVKIVEKRRCRAYIKRGFRTGSLCDRPTKKNSYCTNHYKQYVKYRAV